MFERKVIVSNKMTIKTTTFENNNPKKAPVFAFGYAEAGKGTEAEGSKKMNIEHRTSNIEF